VAANTGASPRSGTLTIAGKTFTVNQAGALPAITRVVDGASFLPSIVAGSWVSIIGSNLSSATRMWAAGDFDGNQLPTSLDGVQVKINGQLAAVYYISPAQVNVQAPANLSGNVTVQVTATGADSNTVTVAAVSNAPALFTYTNGSKTFPAAVYPDATIVGDESLIPGTRKATPGDRILLYATGLVASSSGTIIAAPVPTLPLPVVTVGAAPAIVEFAGLVAVGEFQINIVVPSLPAGDHQITLTIAGKASQPDVTISIAP
jgi:uncharacterized protein (TIGR03437 family)